VYLFLFAPLFSCSVSSYKIMEKDLRTQISYLASDSLKGRYPGTPEDSVLQIYLSNEFKKYGLSLPFENGIQSFYFPSAVKLGKNIMEAGAKNFTLGEDFTPFNFSSNGKVSAEVVFAGYGISYSHDSLHWDNYAGLDVKDKWVILFRDLPPMFSNRQVFGDSYSDLNKVLKAKDLGAAGVLLVSPTYFKPDDQLGFSEKYQADAGIPAIHITRNLAEFLLSANDESLVKLEGSIPDSGKAGFSSGLMLSTITELIPVDIKTANIVGFIQGIDTVLKDEFIIIGAHYDHLGMGGIGSSSRQPDTIAVHSGADDNASGVASVLELAAWFSNKKQKLPRSVVFILFGAEEKGVLGSIHYTEKPVFPLNKTMIMINIDMLGRMNPDSSLNIGGTGTTAISEKVLNQINNDYNFNLNMNPAGYGPSDHAPFYAKDIPVLFFSTGAHQDYHTPHDKIELLNLPAQERITKYIASVVEYLSKLDTKPDFIEAGPKAGSSMSFTGKVTLGIMPDTGDQSSNGLKVLAVSPGKPAYSGGMLKGDVIIAIDGKEIGNIYDYMYRLNQLSPGQNIIVTVKRNTQQVELLIQL
jgi:aminopeptidase YwaD